MIKGYTYGFVILLTLIMSCREDEIVYENLNGFENLNRAIIFDVYHVYDFSPVSDSTVQDATIAVYASYEDLMLNFYPDASRVTDSAGHAEINGLGADYYYIKCTHTELGTVIDSVSTPSGTTSFVELMFY